MKQAESKLLLVESYGRVLGILPLRELILTSEVVVQNLLRECHRPIPESTYTTSFLVEKLQTRDVEALVTVTEDGRLVKVHTQAQLLAKLAREYDSLRAEVQRAKEANDRKTHFLANVSHEIRTPMTSILGFTELLIGKEQEQQNREHLETIQKNGLYLLEVVNDILDLTKIEAGHVTLRRIPIYLGPFISDIHSLMMQRATAKKIQLEVDFASQLPKWVIGDPIRLKQILVNLIANGINYTNAGSVILKVEFRADPDDTQLRFDVTDTGVGFSSEQAKVLFDPFRQIENVNRGERGGTGLGLAICRHLCDVLGATLEFQSKNGAGSTFSVVLRDCEWGKPISSATLETQVQPVVRSEVAMLPRVPILLVDDRREVRFIVHRMLSDAGAEPALAENGEEALAMVKEAQVLGIPFQLIVMDMQMPVMDGYEATRELRSRKCSTPILALSAGALDVERELCLSAGCNAFLPKPIDRRQLLQMCRQLLEGA